MYIDRAWELKGIYPDDIKKGGIYSPSKFAPD